MRQENHHTSSVSLGKRSTYDPRKFSLGRSEGITRRKFLRRSAKATATAALLGYTAKSAFGSGSGSGSSASIPKWQTEYRYNEEMIRRQARYKNSLGYTRWWNPRNNTYVDQQPVGPHLYIACHDNGGVWSDWIFV